MTLSLDDHAKTSFLLAFVVADTPPFHTALDPVRWVDNGFGFVHLIYV